MRGTHEGFRGTAPVRAAAAALALALLLQPMRARAIENDVWISPGIRLAYTFGVGFVFGIETSFVWVPSTWDDLKQRPVGLGFVVSLDFDFDEFIRLHGGFQVTGPWIGMEIGPSMVTDANGAYFGIAFTPWVSECVIPYYTYTLVIGEMQNLHELGVLLKLHLNTDGDFGGGDLDDD